MYLLADEPIGALAADLQEVLRENPDAAPLTLPTLMAEWLSDDFRGLTTARPATSALRALVVDATSQTVSVLTSEGESVRSWAFAAFAALDWWEDLPGEVIEPGWSARLMAMDSPPPAPHDPGPPHLRVLGALGGCVDRLIAR
jgi:hypothetical protein